MLYLAFKYIHILAAITAVGFNASYAVWLARGDRLSREVHEFTLRGVKLLDDRFANPAYGVLFVTGLLMVFTGPWKITTGWILGALALFAILILMAALGYTPALKSQIRALETSGRESAEYAAAARRQNLIGIAFIVPILGLIYLMVFKPF